MSLTYETLLGLTREKSLLEYAQHVIRWNDVARKARGGAYTDKDLQWSFVKEEFDETLAALRAGDRIEAVDGACDMFVVASYALYLDKKEALPIYCTQSTKVDFSLVELEQAVHETKNPYVALKHIVAFLFRLDIPLAYNLKEVLSSNDSKYPTIAELREWHPGKDLVDALDQECEDIQLRSNGRYKGVTYNRVDDRVVFFDSNGKIMKPITFRTPKIIA